MTRKEIFEYYVKQSENVRFLKKALRQINLKVNESFKRLDSFQIDFYTKLYAFVYSSWSEAQFTQVVYTPDGFMLSEINKILKTKEQNGISEGWRKMISIAISKVGKLDEKNKELRKRLNNAQLMVKSYIEEPSIIRNKLAHGQWINAFNSKNTAFNQEITDKIGSLDPVVIGKNIKIHTYFGEIVRDLVQSPKKGFHKNYYIHVTNLEKYIIKTKNWSLSHKKITLQNRTKSRPKLLQAN